MEEHQWSEAPEPFGERSRVPPPVRTAVGTGGSRPRTALVASTDRREVHRIVSGLERLGIRTTGLVVPKALQELLDHEPPGVLVLDLDLPELDGLALLNHMKADARTAGIAVILLSTQPTDTDVFVAWESGADLLLTRPVVVQEIVQAVRKLLDD